MPRKHQRPPSGGVNDGIVPIALSPDSTAAGTPPQDPEAAVSIPTHDKLRWTPRDLEALTGMSWRWMLMEISAGRMPPPDLRLGRSVGYRPSTIRAWLDGQTRRGGRA
jgi:predicted DNA-binding transcriptional regulator AlpA